MKAQAISSMDRRLPPVTRSIACPSTDPPACSKPSNIILTAGAATTVRQRRWRPRSPPLLRTDGASTAGRRASGGGPGPQVSYYTQSHPLLSAPARATLYVTERGGAWCWPRLQTELITAEVSLRQERDPEKAGCPYSTSGTETEENERLRGDHPLRIAGHLSPACLGCGAPRHGAGKGRAEGSQSEVCEETATSVARSVIAPVGREVISAYVASAGGWLEFRPGGLSTAPRLSTQTRCN